MHHFEYVFLFIKSILHFNMMQRLRNTLNHLCNSKITQICVLIFKNSILFFCMKIEHKNLNAALLKTPPSHFTHSGAVHKHVHPAGSAVGPLAACGGAGKWCRRGS